ncbi:hypothetical protein, partial [Nesterenkonia massiliensis]
MTAVLPKKNSAWRPAAPHESGPLRQGVRGVVVMSVLGLSLIACSPQDADAGPHTGTGQNVPAALAADAASAAPEPTASPTEHSMDELAQMSFAEFRSGEVSQAQRYQLLWHYAQLSEDHPELFGQQEGLFAYNPTNLAHPGNSAENILLQHWYLQQLYRVGEVLALQHGGEDIALKLARTVDPDGVEQ